MQTRRKCPSSSGHCSPQDTVSGSTFGQRSHVRQILQPKLSAGAADDTYEKEADKIAEEVMQKNLSASTRSLPSKQRNTSKGDNAGTEENESSEQTKIAKQPDDKEDALQQKSNDAQTFVPSQLPGAVSSVINQTGSPLDPLTQASMENRFGTSFDDIRVHNDPAGSQSANAIRARAYTVGNHIVFANGQYQPNSLSGQKLLAHELTHTIQQQQGKLVQRACDPVLLNNRANPVFFPQDSDLMAVFNGNATMSQSPTTTDAVGLVQQALVDLGFQIGSWGPRNDGVDREYGPDTAGGVTAFQASENIPQTGTVDQQTLKCLDEIRSKRTVPQHQTGSVPADQFQINSAETGGRDEDIFFDRGSSQINAEGFQKISRLTTQHKGCQLTLEGYMSEDERVDTGDQLANDRLQSVNLAFFFRSQQDAGVCNPAQTPARVLRPLPGASSGVSNYRKRRKVEIVPPNQQSTTAACAPGAVTTRAPNFWTEMIPTFSAIFNSANFIDQALNQLTPNNSAGDAALTEYFGGTQHRATVRTNLTTWKNHILNNITQNHQVGTPCLDICRSAIAFNTGSGSNAMMTLCPKFFTGFPIPQEISGQLSLQQAFVILHEAGHGSIGTSDFAYGHRRGVEFLDSFSQLALDNTDSYTRMVFCLAGHSAFCSPRIPVDQMDPQNITTAADQEKVRRGLAWLESWMQWTGQDTGSAYSVVDRSRRGGNWTNTHYQGVFNTLAQHFDLHRPRTDTLPTFREQLLVAAVNDRLRLMRGGAKEGVTVHKNVSANPTMFWHNGNPGPKQEVTITDQYLALTSDRARVERMLPLIITATGSIDTSRRANYENYIKAIIARNWGNNP